MPEIYIVGLLGHITQYYKAIILQLKNNNNSNKNYFLFFFLKVQNVLFFFFKFENFDLDIGSEVFVRSLSPRNSAARFRFFLENEACSTSHRNLPNVAFSRASGH